MSSQKLNLKSRLRVNGIGLGKILENKDDQGNWTEIALEDYYVGSDDKPTKTKPQTSPHYLYSLSLSDGYLDRIYYVNKGTKVYKSA
jgi:hypothetical protein